MLAHIHRKRTGEQRVSVLLPELLQLANQSKELSFLQPRARSIQSGQQLSRLLGRGMEFAECRRYQAGDDIRNIDWKVTARTGKAHTKLFAAEKERQVLLCVDLRSPMFFATKGVFKSVQTSIIAGLLAWNAVQNGNRLGGIIFNNDNHTELRPALGKRGALPFLQSLAENAVFSSQALSSKGVPSMDDAVKSIHKVVVPGSSIYVMSDFRYLSSFAYNLLIDISRHSDLNLCFVYDSIEANLPKNGSYPVTNGKRDLVLSTFDNKNLEIYRQKFNERRETVKSLGNHPHIHFLECSTEDDCFEVLKTWTM